MSKTLVVIDVQEKLLPAVQNSSNLLKTISKVLKAHKLLKKAIVVTEQYPKGLGPTVAELSAEFDDIAVISKTSFSCFCDEFKKSVEPPNKTDLILVGIESHVCVYQTCLEALRNGYKVTVLVDAVSSRSKIDMDIALKNMEKAGAHLSTFECEYMQQIEDARHPQFKEFSKLLKD